jgi:hypothetical protein
LKEKYAVVRAKRQKKQNKQPKADSQQPTAMAVPRDPQFWKRFSHAVHLDEEAAQVTEK